MKTMTIARRANDGARARDAEAARRRGFRIATRSRALAARGLAVAASARRTTRRDRGAATTTRGFAATTARTATDERDRGSGFARRKDNWDQPTKSDRYWLREKSQLAYADANQTGDDVPGRRPVW